MKKRIFKGLNNVITETDGSKIDGDGLYFDPDEVVAIEGRRDAGGVSSIIHLKSGTRFHVLGSAFHLLAQIGLEDATNYSGEKGKITSEQ